jgi:hypothetical protein
LVVIEAESILIAGPDPALLQDLSFFISRHLPGTRLTLCLSAQQTLEKLSRSTTYSTVIAASCLIQEEAPIILHQKRKRHALVPLLLTAGHGEREFARAALLHQGVFDILARPPDQSEALASIKVAQWQARFLGLLTQRERVLFQVRRHLADFPHERDTRGAREWISKRVNDTLVLVGECKDVIDLRRLDGLLLDFARSVEEWTRERALDRLERMSVECV